MNTRIFSIAIVALFTGAALAGCASDNGTDPTPSGTTTPASTTPGSTTPATPGPLPTPPTSALPITPPITLKMGFINPLTGDLSNLGPSMQNAMDLAAADINAVTALTGLSINVVGREDDGTGDVTVGSASYDELVGLGATAIAGPCCSGITSTVLTKAVEDNVVISSPSATSPTITENDHQGYFWRVSPTDAGQGRVLAQLVREDGHDNVNLIVVNNDYGNGFAGVFQEEFEGDGGNVGTISQTDPTGTVVSSQVTEACAGSPDAIVLVLYTKQGAEVLKAMQAANCLAGRQVYASEGVYSPTFAESIVEEAGKDPSGKWLAEGMKGTTPQAVDLSAFTTPYQAKYNSAPQQYAPESYDAVMYIALGALAAKSVDSEDIITKMLDLANPGGAKCRAFRDCALFILAGQDIDFQGYAHDLEFINNNGSNEPKVGAYSHWQVNAEGEMEITKENIIPS